MQQEQERKQRMTSVLLRVGVVVVALAVVAGLTIFALNRDGGEGASSGPAPSAATENGGIVLASSTELLDGDGLDEIDADSVPGDSGEAPGGVEGDEGELPHVVIYTDPECPSCQAFEGENHEQIGQWLDEGLITVEYRSVNFLGQYSQRANNAVACMAEESPENYFSFLGQATISGEMSTDELSSLAADAYGADISDCIDDGDFRAFTSYVTNQASAESSVEGTPTVFLDGEVLGDWREGAFTAAVEEAIEGSGEQDGDAEDSEEDEAPTEEEPEESPEDDGGED